MDTLGTKTKLQHDTGEQFSARKVDMGVSSFKFSYYPTGTGREGCVVLLQATDDELGSSDSRDCVGEDTLFSDTQRWTREYPHL